MKKATIEAYNGIGKDKKLAGKREVDQPETIEEAVTLETAENAGDEKLGKEAVLEGYWSSKTIEIQRQIRAGTTMTAKAALAKLQAYAMANPDSEVAKTLALLEISTKGTSEVVNAPSETPSETPAPTQETPPSETPPEEPTPERPARGRNRK